MPNLWDRIAGGGPGRAGRRMLRRLVGASGTAVLSGQGARRWGDAVTAAHPGAAVLYPAASDLLRLDAWCGERGIRHIDLLMLEAGAAAAALAPFAYRFFRLGLRVLKPVAAGAQGGRTVALNERLLPLMFDLPKVMLDLGALCRANGIVPKGVIHVGAHEGQEWAAYRRMGVADALFIEANPAVFARLQAAMGTPPGVTLANVAIAASDGPVTLHVTSFDQSSSILPLHRHSEHYPTIVETEAIEVPGRRLDTLMQELNLSGERFNLLAMDIQGAELQALAGAVSLLDHIEAINVEVSFEELYRGCGQIEELDAALAAKGFRRVAVTCPYHKSWGDAFYVRSPCTDEARPV